MSTPPIPGEPKQLTTRGNGRQAKLERVAFWGGGWHAAKPTLTPITFGHYYGNNSNAYLEKGAGKAGA